VVTAHRMAIESKLVRADMVVASEFPHLAIRHNVRGVPRTVVNETGYIEGAMPEGAFIEAVMKAARQSSPETGS